MVRGAAGLVAATAARQQHEDELAFLPWFGQPGDAAGAPVDHLQVAEVAVEGDARIDGGNLDGDMGQCRAHRDMLSPRGDGG